MLHDTGWVQLIWGLAPFNVRTASWQSLRETRDWSWASTPRLGDTPAHQFTGTGDARISLDCAVFPGRLGAKRHLVKYLTIGVAECQIGNA